MGAPTAFALGLHQTRIERRDSEAAGNEEPAVIGDDPHLPAGPRKAHHPVRDIAQADLHLLGHAGAESVALLVERPGLAPELALGQQGHRRAPARLGKGLVQHGLARGPAVLCDGVQVGTA